MADGGPGRLSAAEITAIVVRRLTESVWLCDAEAGGFPTIAAAVLTPRRAFVIDTLTGPQAISPVRAFLEEHAADRRLTVVNTHHHWDHVFGNALFAGDEIVAHDACPGRMNDLVCGAGEPAPPPPNEGVPLPGVTFSAGLTYIDGSCALRLLHAPGHTPDSIVAFLEPEGVLFAGDTLEWPLPSLSDAGGVSDWLRTLALLGRLCPNVCVPSHGPAMGPELISANERYLRELADAVGAARRAGRTPGDESLAGEAFVAEPQALGQLYRDVHAANVALLWKGIATRD